MTERTIKRNLKKIDQVLLQLARAKAKAESNDYLLTLLYSINVERVTTAERDMLNDILGIPEGSMVELFGECWGLNSLLVTTPDGRTLSS
jgi:hypothetical protein